ncbi:MAG: GNAT family N-acetyltransferase [Betaproteobacteria bacterium]|nr:GNAT family N-acetyltransferase [Betaproteobacteria bacterium]
MAILLETERLNLRRVTLADCKEIARMNSDPQVMRYVGDGKPRSREMSETGVRRMLRMYDVYPGLGIWVGETRRARRFIGIFILTYIPRTVEVEIGYRLPREAWGKGYATEGATALLRYGFESVGLDRIVAVTYPQNRASRHVLKKIGLVDRGMSRYYGKDVTYYVAERARFLSGTNAA